MYTQKADQPFFPSNKSKCFLRCLTASINGHYIYIPTCHQGWFKSIISQQSLQIQNFKKRSTYHEDWVNLWLSTSSRICRYDTTIWKRVQYHETVMAWNSGIPFKHPAISTLRGFHALKYAQVHFTMINQTRSQVEGRHILSLFSLHKTKSLLIT